MEKVNIYMEFKMPNKLANGLSIYKSKKLFIKGGGLMQPSRNQ